MVFSKTIVALCVAAVAFSNGMVDASVEVVETYGKSTDSYNTNGDKTVSVGTGVHGGLGAGLNALLHVGANIGADVAAGLSAGVLRRENESC
ncbi:hypothetical protein P3T76_006647 [Phytophthora citrophthora]|uniref:Uncharacterized protein n=1 Tax=Phytophthora citrophthora TaxID=4793 RepID=A0AAD9GPD9_9STRA|nr:hypothetical protein P3T76_006647 [Phytophthora citrophthora]